VGLCHQIFGLPLVHTRQADVEVHVDAKSLAVVTGTDADRGGDPRVVGDFRFLLSGRVFERAQKTRRVACSKELLGIVAVAAFPAQFSRRGQLDVETAVRGRCPVVAAAGSARWFYSRSSSESPSG
jgi:hypothetical protein